MPFSAALFKTIFFDIINFVSLGKGSIKIFNGFDFGRVKLSGIEERMVKVGSVDFGSKNSFTIILDNRQIKFALNRILKNLRQHVATIITGIFLAPLFVLLSSVKTVQAASLTRQATQPQPRRESSLSAQSNPKFELDDLLNCSDPEQKNILRARFEIAKIRRNEQRFSEAFKKIMANKNNPPIK